MNKYFCKKHGSVTTITLFAIMCVLFPMLAIIYDIGMMHIYKQDLKNIQDLAGTTCAPNAETKGLSQECGLLAKRYVAMNIAGKDIPSGLSNSSSAIRNLRATKGITRCDSKKGKSRLCTESGDRSTNNVIAEAENGKLRVTIKGIKYKPLFLNKNLFRFGNAKAPSNTPETNEAIELKIPPSSFSGTYQYNGKTTP